MVPRVTFPDTITLFGDDDMTATVLAEVQLTAKIMDNGIIILEGCDNLPSDMRWLWIASNGVEAKMTGSPAVVGNVGAWKDLLGTADFRLTENFKVLLAKQQQQQSRQGIILPSRNGMGGM